MRLFVHTSGHAKYRRLLIVTALVRVRVRVGVGVRVRVRVRVRISS